MTPRVLTTCVPPSSICPRNERVLSDVLEGCVIKLDIVNAVVTTTNISRTKAEQAVETVFESLKTALGRGQRIELRRFGVFSVKPRKTGIGRNPRTGEEVNIPPGKAVRFKPGKELQGLEEEAKSKSSS
jgi:DNA-binding protein HU-beta